MTPTPQAGKYAELVRPLSERERVALKESLERDGFWPTHPVVTDEDGTIILGHHRFAIATELGIEPVVTTVTGLGEEEKARLAIADNVHRRQLTGTERNKLARQLREFGLSVRRISEVMAVPKSTVARALNGDTPEAPAETPAVPPGTPDRVTGRDGKSYRSTGKKKPPPVIRPTSYGPDGVSADGESQRMPNGTVRNTPKGEEHLKIATGLEALRSVARASRHVTPEEFAAAVGTAGAGAGAANGELRREARGLISPAVKWLLAVQGAIVGTERRTSSPTRKGAGARKRTAPAVELGGAVSEAVDRLIARTGGA